jgi:AmmeMemoRadiSam system protein B
MQSEALKSRPAKCSGWWYPSAPAAHNFKNNPVSSAVIAPHAGFDFSGMVALQSVSYVKKNRVWILGTSHYERIKNGISIFRGTYSSSIGKAIFPEELTENELGILNAYFTNEGHRTDEHSIENILYCLNHFNNEIKAFCVLVQETERNCYEKISDDIVSIWKPGDSIIVSTDWNHFVPTSVINRLMSAVTKLLAEGDFETLYKECSRGNLEACGIDGLYLAGKILRSVGESTRFKVLVSTDSSQFAGRKHDDKCVGYIAAANNLH